MFCEQKSGLPPVGPRKVASLIRMFEYGATATSDINPVTDEMDTQFGSEPEYDTRDTTIKECHTQERNTCPSTNEQSAIQTNNETDQSSTILDQRKPSKQDKTGPESVSQQPTDTNTGCTEQELSTEQVIKAHSTTDQPGTQKGNIQSPGIHSFSSQDSVTDEENIPFDYSTEEKSTPAPSTTEGGKPEDKPRKLLDLRQLKEGLKAVKPDRELKRELSTIIEECENETEESDDPVPLKSRRTSANKRTARLSIYPPEVGQDSDTVGNRDTMKQDEESSPECLPGCAAEHEIACRRITGNTDTITEILHDPTDNTRKSRGACLTEATPLIHTSTGAIYRMLALSPLKQSGPPVKPDIIWVDVDSFYRSMNSDIDPQCPDQIYDDVNMDQPSDVPCEDRIYQHID